jgi:putative ABC transport system substrate-binding protein
LVQLPVNAIVACGGDHVVRAAKAATATIPIVATIGNDPVETGLVRSVNRPGGNLTGVSVFAVSPSQIAIRSRWFTRDASSPQPVD